MTSCLLEKRQLLRRSVRRLPKQTFDVDDFFVVVERPDITISAKPKAWLVSMAKPTAGPTEFENNPILRIHPASGKHYRMVVVRRSVAVFEPTSPKAHSAEM